MVSQPIHRSEIARTKYCGGSGSKSGMVNESSAGSSFLSLCSKKSSLW